MKFTRVFSLAAEIGPRVPAGPPAVVKVLARSLQPHQLHIITCKCNKQGSCNHEASCHIFYPISHESLLKSLPSSQRTIVVLQVESE